MTNDRLLEVIADLRVRYAQVERIDPASDTYGALCRLLDSAEDGTLVILAASDIRFVSPLARNRCIRRGLRLN